MSQRIRKRCVRRGHKWFVIEGVPLPFEFCSRMFCDGERVSPTYPLDPELRALFEQYLAKKMREEIRHEHSDSQEG